MFEPTHLKGTRFSDAHLRMETDQPRLKLRATASCKNGFMPKLRKRAGTSTAFLDISVIQLWSQHIRAIPFLQQSGKTPDLHFKYLHLTELMHLYPTWWLSGHKHPSHICILPPLIHLTPTWRHDKLTCLFIDTCKHRDHVLG